jgi:uncharacterized membrane protein YphA (DoxX/SURF4 family)
MQPTLTYERKWAPGTLIAFRFVFSYFVIYIAPFPLHFIPYVGYGIQPFRKLFFAATEQFGRLIFGAGYVLPPESTGSGDTMHNYVQLLFLVLIAAVATISWSALDSKRNNYEKLLYWFMIWLRYYLAVIMFSYGFSKVFRIQFPSLTLDQLNKSYGESSPMNLLWTFMGASGPYTIFAGLGEVVGGMLLLFRRTRLLGALVVAIVMIQVVMLNFSYDVPVKLYSSHLLLIAFLIMSPDATRLLNFFILNKTVEPEPVNPLYNTKQRQWIYFAVKGVLLIYLVTLPILESLDQRTTLKEFFAKVQPGNSINGEYEIETFVVNSDTLPALENDTRRWKTMTIKDKKIELQNMDGASIGWHFIGNVGYKRMVIHSTDLSTYGNFTFRSDSTLLTMKGTINNDTLNVVARRKTGSEYLLVSRGFHWVNELPYNR